MSATRQPASDPAQPDEQRVHFVGAIGLEQWSEGPTTHGRAQVRPELCVPGTTHPRIGVLATMVDLVAGSQPAGPINPTVDLHLHLMSFPAMSAVRVTCDVLRAGRTLLVGEVRLYAEGDRRPFGRSLLTFMNRPMAPWPDGRPLARPGPPPGRPIEALLSARHPAPGVVEIDPLPHLSNGTGGTVQGGVLALLAELATEQSLAAQGPCMVTDLDIRYLNAVRRGPVRATAEVLASTEGGADVQVRLVDTGDQGRLVAFVATSARRL